ncbi:hypothetical protein ACQB6R_09765 [Propionibacteriaceae bacterium G1746]|uniref:hypothetical protein n=1 Tax=Aestuariimicrobium sp. G57 TaxID=3418485 RepID=UPI003C29B7F6
MTRNTISGETSPYGALVKAVLRRVESLLPASWRLHLQQDGLSTTGIDGVVTLAGPTGDAAEFAVQAKRGGLPVGVVLSLLARSSAGRPLLFVSDYLGPALRDALDLAGVSYADATGWVRIVSDEPLILLTGQGASKSPRAGRGSSLVRLNGPATGRIIRALCEVSTPVGVRELAGVAGVSPGSVSKLVPTLVAESVVDRSPHGDVTAVRRRALIERWVRDYSFEKTNQDVGWFIHPRGLDRALERLERLAMPTTLTGSAAARQLLPEGVTSVAPMQLVAVYAQDPDALVSALGLVEVDPASANFVVGIPQDVDVLNKEIAPPALVIADLMTLPGRGDAEAEQLMDALARGDAAWGS